MEPIKPKNRKKALDTGGTEEELLEYNTLIAQRLETDPLAVPTPDQRRAAKEREQRIADLHHKLFSDI